MVQFQGPPPVVCFAECHRNCSMFISNTNNHVKKRGFLVAQWPAPLQGHNQHITSSIPQPTTATFPHNTQIIPLASPLLLSHPSRDVLTRYNRSMSRPNSQAPPNPASCLPCSYSPTHPPK